MSKPKHVTLDRKNQRLVIQWADGATSDYALNVLREACPCADCRGGHANMGKPPDIDNLLLIPLARVKSYDVSKLEPVGHYALRPTWGDGHDAGIFTWPYLRELGDGLASKSGPGGDSPGGRQDPRYHPLGK
ncbi:MAG: DUF971 domain-containing protein [Anaerolineales bacterium]|nr:DUF971 domain-containing protein [Anaerolineales bacterium]